MKGGEAGLCALTSAVQLCDDRIVKEAFETLRGGEHIEYSSAGDLLLLYQGKLTAYTYIQMHCSVCRRPHPGCRDQEKAMHSTRQMSWTEPVPVGACRSVRARPMIPTVEEPT